jgi:hypothetical protein
LNRNQLNLTKLGLLGSKTPAADDERIVELFRNRAELKKAYAELQDEIYALKDRLKQQEGVTARVQEMLDELEQRLEAPLSAFQILVFYQLRRLWKTGTQILERLAASVELEHTERATRAFFLESNRRRFERRRELETAVRDAEQQAAAARERLHELTAARANAAMPWSYFKRKELDSRIALARSQLSAAEMQVQPATAAFAAFEQQGVEPFPGLPLEARRAINHTLIAGAEQLCLRLSKTSLLAQAKSANARRSVSDDYGTRADCEALMNDIARAIALLEQKAPAPADLTERAEHARKQARYRNESDTIPDPESLAVALPELDPLAPQVVRNAPLPNVLGEDLWDLSKVLRT